MPRRRSTYTQAEIKRAVCAMLAAGVKVSGVRVDADGFTVLTEPIQAETPSGEAQNAADVFSVWMKEQDDGSR